MKVFDSLMQKQSELEQFKSLLNELPQKLYEIRLTINELNSRLREAREDLELAEMELIRAIIYETDEKGKPAFSNDTARKAELVIRKKTDFQYQKCLKTLTQLESKLEEYKTEVKKLEEQYAVTHRLIEATTAELQVYFGIFQAWEARKRGM